MKVILEPGRCQLHGECMVAAPEVFDIPEDADEVAILDDSPREHLRSKVEEAVMMCPVSALRLEG